ncbi:MAG: DUF433 domain-containing protein, partial [Afipia sp.]|nr:DUF433 domain-containing protein [Afipia sp.]
ILSGVPVLRGTRMPVFMVADMRRAGMSIEAMLAEYPSLNAELIELAEVYAATHRRVRPPAPAWRSQAPLGAALVSRRYGPQSRGGSNE